MENEKNLNEKLDKDTLDKVAGGDRAETYGYCPYTEDRKCRLECVGRFDNSNEDCQTCGYRAW